MKLVISGVLGRMGNLVYKRLKDSKRHLIIAGIDKEPENSKMNIPIYKNFVSVINNEEFDCLIDFTIQPFACEIICKAIANGINVISGTTGWTKSQLDYIEMLASEKNVSLIISPNFSLGIKMMNKFLLSAVETFTHIAFTELHHVEKVDVPSGTALALYDTFVKAHGKSNIDISEINSYRLPGVLATHEVILANDNETFKISHSANSRESFIDGVVLMLDEIMKKQVIKIGI